MLEPLLAKVQFEVGLFFGQDFTLHVPVQLTRKDPQLLLVVCMQLLFILPDEGHKLVEIVVYLLKQVLLQQEEVVRQLGNDLFDHLEPL